MFGWAGTIFHHIVSTILGALALIGVGAHVSVVQSPPITIATEIQASTSVEVQATSTAATTTDQIAVLQAELNQEKSAREALQREISNNSNRSTKSEPVTPIIVTPLVPATTSSGGALSGQDIYKKVSPSVVYISWGDSQYKYSGSGFVINGGKYTMTNAHVLRSKVDGSYARTVNLGLANGDNFTGYVLGENSDVDLAIIYNANQQAPTATIGDPEGGLPIGSDVYALGYPETFDGLTNMTLTKGTLSAKQQNVLGSGPVLETTAAINPGNSGGPLVNEKGEIVGVNTFSINNTQGLYFAIPIDRAMQWVPDLSQNGQSRYELYPIGSSQTIKASVQLKIQLNPDTACSALGLLPADLTPCTLYKTYPNDYTWVVVDDLHNP